MARRQANPARLALEEEVRRRLGVADYRGASMSVAAFEAMRPEPRGIGIDWKNYDPFRDVAALTAIHERVPAILDGVRADALPTLRLAASMMLLLGTGPVRRWIQRDLTTGTRFGGDVSAYMLLFYGMKQAQIASWSRDFERAGVAVARVRISACGADSCAPCREIANNIFAANRLPELPYQRCISPMGCRCIYMEQFS
jgi:hypothetical protein